MGSNDGLGHEDGYRLAAEAFRDVAAAFAGGENLESLLQLMARRACSLIGVSRCSIYLRREHGQLFKGRITYIAGEDPDRAIRQLTAGVEADRFTHEIVSTQQPVLVHDARSDPRVVRTAMRDWHVKAILGLPMIFDGEVRGIMFLDNAEVRHNYTPKEEQIGASFANLAAVAVVIAEQAVSLREATDATAEQNRLLRRITVAYDMLARRFASDATFLEIAALVTEVTGQPCWIYGDDHRLLASAGLPDVEVQTLRTPIDASARQYKEVVRALGEITGPEPVVIGPLLHARLDRRFLVTPVLDDIRLRGFAVLGESQGAMFNAFDKAIARRVAGLLLSRMSTERHGTELRRIAGESLALDLINGWKDTASIEDRAGVLHFDLAQDHAICTMTAGPGTVAPSCLEATAAFADLNAPSVLCCRTGAEVVVIFLLSPEDPFLDRLDEAKRVISKAGERLFGESGFVASLISAAGDPARYAVGFRAAQAMLTWATELDPVDLADGKVLTAHDIDLGRLLGSGRIDGETARRLAAEILGALVSEPSLKTLLSTLVGYLDASCNIREAADDLGVHHNTIRYRLARIQELTGLLVATRTRDLLKAQLALNVLDVDEKVCVARLEGSGKAQAQVAQTA
jgi:sugar diacid utilization regulator